MSEEKKKKTIYKKWWFWVAIVLVLGVFGSLIDDEEEETASNNDVEETVNNESDNNDEENGNNNDEKDQEEMDSETVDNLIDFHDEVIPKLDELDVQLEGMTPQEFIDDVGMSDVETTLDELQEMNKEYKDKFEFVDMDVKERTEEYEDQVIEGKNGDIEAEEFITDYTALRLDIEDVMEYYEDVKENYSDDNFEKLDEMLEFLEEDKQEMKDTVNGIK